MDPPLPSRFPGKCLSLREVSNKIESGYANCSLASHKIRHYISSGPADLLTFNLDNLIKTSETSTVISSMSLILLLLKLKCVVLNTVSEVKTLLKDLHKTSALRLSLLQ